MTTYKLHIVLTNEDRNLQFSEWSEDIEDWLLKDDGTPDTGRIFKLLQGEYGRCISKIYRDRPGQPAQPCGWFFQSRQRYEDTGLPYLRGAWCELQRVTSPAQPEHREAVEIP